MLVFVVHFRSPTGQDVAVFEEEAQARAYAGVLRDIGYDVTLFNPIRVLEFAPTEVVMRGTRLITLE